MLFKSGEYDLKVQYFNEDILLEEVNHTLEVKQDNKKTLLIPVFVVLVLLLLYLKRKK